MRHRVAGLSARVKRRRCAGVGVGVGQPIEQRRYRRQLCVEPLPRRERQTMSCRARVRTLTALSGSRYCSFEPNLTPFARFC
jgi:hypothetical protein